MPRDVKLIGFLVLLVVIFIGARAAGAALGPVTTGHAQVTYTGPGSGSGSGSGSGGGGMKMGGNP